jgi:hypothetical protein
MKESAIQSGSGVGSKVALSLRQETEGLAPEGGPEVFRSRRSLFDDSFPPSFLHTCNHVLIPYQLQEV